MGIRFKKPPIDEVVIGAYFDPPVNSLRSEHIGLLWSRFRDDFPTVAQHPPLGIEAPIAMPVAGNGVEFLVMPRYWFVSEDQTYVIQVQKNALILNWRRLGSIYPHFAECLKPKFDEIYAIFEKFIRQEVGEGSLRVGRSELTYVDVIKPCEFWRVAEDTPNIIPSFAFPARGPGSEATSELSNVYRYELNSNLNLKVSIRTATSKESGSLCLVLEFNARGKFDGIPKPDTETWYFDAHDAVVKWFLSLTSVEIQRKYWIPEGEGE